MLRQWTCIFLWYNDYKIPLVYSWRLKNLIWRPKHFLWSATDALMKKVISNPTKICTVLKTQVVVIVMFESTVMLFPIPHPVLQLTDTLCRFLYPEKSRGHLEEIKVEIKAIREKLDALTSLRQENNVEGKFYNSIPQFSHLFCCL